MIFGSVSSLHGLFHLLDTFLSGYGLRFRIFTIRFSTETRDVLAPHAGALLAGVGATPNCERYRLKYSSFRKKQPYRISGSCTKVNLGTKNSGVNHENPIFLQFTNCGKSSHVLGLHPIRMVVNRWFRPIRISYPFQNRIFFIRDPSGITKPPTQAIS